MKKIYKGISITLLTILTIAPFNYISAQNGDDPGIPCPPDDPDCPNQVPLDTNVVYLLVGGIALYLVARARDKKVTA